MHPHVCTILLPFVCDFGSALVTSYEAVLVSGLLYSGMVVSTHNDVDACTK